MGQAAKELRDVWRQRYKNLLDSIFEECASGEITLGPDEAMEWMEECLEKLASGNDQSKLGETRSGPVSTVRFDVTAYRRETHHYAVDRYYKTYFPRRRGAPPLPDHYYDPILRLRFKGLNYAAIAEKLGVPKERIRKQVTVAEKRWREEMAKIEQIKQRFPHLVAGFAAPLSPAIKNTKQRVAGKQSKRQTAKRPTGK